MRPMKKFIQYTENKKGFQKGSLYLNTQRMNMNYYFAWIANFGVVPLFLFLAFLLLPAAFFLFALLIDVTAVLETMVILLPNHIYHLKFIRLRSTKVAKIPQCVKIFIPIFSYILSSSYANAQTTITIPIKEDIEIATGGIASYSVKNPDFIHAEYNNEKKLLTIRANAPINTEIELIPEKGSSNDQLPKILSIKAINKTFLKEIGQYQKFVQKKQSSKESAAKVIAFDNYELHPSLKKEIWSETQKLFFQSMYKDINCHFENIILQCFHLYQTADFLDFQNELSKKYLIQFIKLTKNSIQKNYLIKLKLISLENKNGLDIHLGLDELSGSLNDFFQFPLKEIVGKNMVLLNQNHTEVNLLGEPTFSTLVNQENIFSIGQEIPFRIKSENGKSSIQFKFAGLALKMRLIESGSQYKIDYMTELTRPEVFQEDVAISGNKQSSAVSIKLGDVIKIFEIEFQTDQKTRSFLPLLGTIPILGELFNSRSNQSSRKKIIGLISLSEL